MDEEEIIYAMRIAKDKIEELRTQLKTNHERAEEIIRAREATIARQGAEIDELRKRLGKECYACEGEGFVQYPEFEFNTCERCRGSGVLPNMSDQPTPTPASQPASDV